MKILLLIILVFGLAGCASSGDRDVTLEQATINAQPITGGKYKITVKGYSSKTPTPKLK